LDRNPIAEPFHHTSPHFSGELKFQNRYQIGCKTEKKIKSTLKMEVKRYTSHHPIPKIELIAEPRKLCTSPGLSDRAMYSFHI
jgi:hypothetical protein